MEIAIISFVILIFSIIIHEVAHGYMAEYLGDPTARHQGRLTLNPIAHIDPYGSILVPLLLFLSYSPAIIGWAKPVPYNPRNIRNPYGDALVAVAGPAVNLLIAIVCGIVMRSGLYAGNALILNVLYTIMSINTLLCVFNLLPIPPLDGSKVITAFLPRSMRYRYDEVRRQLEQNPLFGIGIAALFVLVFGGVLTTVVSGIVRMILGV
jgi:Zn-dependent protease